MPAKKAVADKPAVNGRHPRAKEDAVDREYVDKGEPARAMPFIVRATLVGTSPLMFHRWDNEIVEAKGKARKGSDEKKRDDVESYVYRDEAGHVCLPGIYLTNALCDTAKYMQDPRSPRKSARDLFKAALVPHIELCPITSVQAKRPAKTWDVLDARRVVIQRAAITRLRPLFLKGWSVTAEIEILTPEYIDASLIHRLLVDCGRLNGMAELRPMYGRFQVDVFEVLKF